MGQLDRLEGSRSPGRMTNGAEGLIRKKDEGLTQQGLWMAAGKLLIRSFLGGIEVGVRSQGSGRAGRSMGTPLQDMSTWQAGEHRKLIVCSFVFASFVSVMF